MFPSTAIASTIVLIGIEGRPTLPYNGANSFSDFSSLSYSLKGRVHVQDE
jgi:hypothetical protein